MTCCRYKACVVATEKKRQKLSKCGWVPDWLLGLVLLRSFVLSASEAVVESIFRGPAGSLDDRDRTNCSLRQLFQTGRRAPQRLSILIVTGNERV